MSFHGIPQMIPLRFYLACYVKQADSGLASDTRLDLLTDGVNKKTCYVTKNKDKYEKSGKYPKVKITTLCLWQNWGPRAASFFIFSCCIFFLSPILKMLYNLIIFDFQRRRTLCLTCYTNNTDLLFNTRTKPEITLVLCNCSQLV